MKSKDAIVQGNGWFGASAILGTLGTLAAAFIVDRMRRAPEPSPAPAAQKQAE